MAASVRETRIQITPQHNSLKTRITPSQLPLSDI